MYTPKDKMIGLIVLEGVQVAHVTINLKGGIAFQRGGEAVGDAVDMYLMFMCALELADVIEGEALRRGLHWHRQMTLDEIREHLPEGDDFPF